MHPTEARPSEARQPLSSALFETKPSIPRCPKKAELFCKVEISMRSPLMRAKKNPYLLTVSRYLLPGVQVAELPKGRFA